VDTEEEEQERNRKKTKTYGQNVMERLTGSPEGRIDNMLQVREISPRRSIPSYFLLQYNENWDCPVVLEMNGTWKP